MKLTERFHRPRRVSDLNRVGDTVYVMGGHMPGYFYLECGACGSETEPLQELSLTDVMTWACTHHLMKS